MLNKVILIGRLTKDPELRYTASGTAIAQFTLAVDRQYSKEKDQKETDFIPIVVWQKQAENCANFLKKGSQAAIDGRIQVRNYENKEGKRVYVTEVVAENVRFLGGNPKKEQQPAAPLEQASNPFEINDEDLPF